MTADGHRAKRRDAWAHRYRRLGNGLLSWHRFDAILARLNRMKGRS